MICFVKYHQTKPALHPEIRSNISSERIFASCVSYSDRASCWMPVLIKNMGRRLPLELACTRVNRVMLIDLFAENYKTRS